MEPPPPIWEYGQCAVGTHPTGIHSCDLVRLHCTIAKAMLQTVNFQMCALPIVTARVVKRSKVMFSQACVTHFAHRGGLLSEGGGLPLEGGSAFWGGLPSWEGGSLPSEGGLHLGGGICIFRQTPPLKYIFRQASPNTYLGRTSL